jgi:hypothetical protein
MRSSQKNIKVEAFLGIAAELGAEPIDTTSPIVFDMAEWIDSLSAADLAEFLDVDAPSIRICDNNLSEFRSSAARWACIREGSPSGLLMLLVAGAPGAFVSCSYSDREARKYIMENRADAVAIAQSKAFPNP